MRRRTRHWLLGGTLALAALGGLSWQLLRETQTAAIANAPPRAAPSPLPPPPPSSIALPVRVPLALLDLTGLGVDQSRAGPLPQYSLGQGKWLLLEPRRVAARPVRQ